MTDAPDTPRPDLLRVGGVHVEYDGEAVLEDVNLALGPGRCLVLAGANGSGKSTLLRVCRPPATGPGRSALRRRPTA